MSLQSEPETGCGATLLPIAAGPGHLGWVWGGKASRTRQGGVWLAEPLEASEGTFVPELASRLLPSEHHPVGLKSGKGSGI